MWKMKKGQRPAQIRSRGGRGYRTIAQMERRWGGTAKLVGNIGRVTHFQGVENGLLKRAWESPDRKYTIMQLVVPTIRTKEVLREIHNVLVLISESTRYFLKSGRDSTGSVIEKMSKTGASNLRPAPRSRDRRLEREGRCNNTSRFVFPKNCSGHSKSFPGNRGRQ